MTTRTVQLHIICTAIAPPPEAHRTHWTWRPGPVHRLQIPSLRCWGSTDIKHGYTEHTELGDKGPHTTSRPHHCDVRDLQINIDIQNTLDMATRARTPPPDPITAMLGIKLEEVPRGIQDKKVEERQGNFGKFDRSMTRGITRQ